MFRRRGLRHLLVDRGRASSAMTTSCEAACAWTSDSPGPLVAEGSSGTSWKPEPAGRRVGGRRARSTSGRGGRRRRRHRRAGRPTVTAGWRAGRRVVRDGLERRAVRAAVDRHGGRRRGRGRGRGRPGCRWRGGGGRSRAPWSWAARAGAPAPGGEHVDRPGHVGVEPAGVADLLGRREPRAYSSRPRGSPGTTATRPGRRGSRRRRWSRCMRVADVHGELRWSEREVLGGDGERRGGGSVGADRPSRRPRAPARAPAAPTAT